MAVNGPAALFGALGKGRAGFEAIKGTPESDWVDFKSQPYRFDTQSNKLELAKDVAALAEVDGGVIVIGIRSEHELSSATDRAAELKPIPNARLNADQIRQIVRQYVYPPPRGLDVRVWPMGEETSVATIHVPRQDGDDKPFIVSEGLAADGTSAGNMFGFFRREGDTIPPVPPSYIHDLIRDGRRYRADRRSEPTGPAPEPVDTTSADERLSADASKLDLEGGPYLTVQAWVGGRSEFDLHGDFREVFLRSEQLRPNGFNVDFYAELESLSGGGVRKATRRFVMSTFPVGLTTLVVGPELVTRSRQGDKSLINSWVLVEFVSELCRFEVLHVWPRIDARTGMFRAALVGLQEPFTFGLPHGLPDIFADANPPAEDADSVRSGVVESRTWENAAFEILARIYRDFGLPEEAIPFADVAARRIDESSLAGA